MTEHTTLPRRLPAGVGMIATVAAVMLVASAYDQTAGILILLPGLALLVAGLRYRRTSPLGYLAVVLGAGVAAVGFVLPLMNPLPTQLILELYAGMLGLGLYALGIGAVRRGMERRFVTAGVAVVFAGILITGVFRGTATSGMLAATVACVVAWDAGEQSISLGEHVGTKSDAWSAGLTHVGATAIVGIGAVAVTVGVDSLSVSGLPLSALLTLLLAALLSLAALYH